MSQSPTSAAASLDSAQRYLDNWDALADMVSHGASFSGRERHCCFLNTRGPRFADVSAATGLDLIDDGRGLALVDWDHDGDLDLWFSNRTGPRVRMMRNDINAGHNFLAVRLEGTKCNRDAIGARVEVHLSPMSSEAMSASGKRGSPSVLTKTLRAGEAFLSQSSKWMHFGLGKATKINRVVVHWPGADKAESFADLQVNRRYRIIQESGNASEVQPRSTPVSLTAAVAKAPPQNDRARTFLTQRLPLPTLQFRDFQEKQHSIIQDTKGPLLINLWASWCRPCLAELDEFARHEPELSESGVRIFALCTDLLSPDQTGDLSAARDFLKRMRLPFQTGIASEALVRDLVGLSHQVFYLRRPPSLPCSFLVDRNGNLATIYMGPVTPKQILADVQLLDAKKSAIVQAAFPFPGRRVAGMYQPSPLNLAREYLLAGYLRDAKAEVVRYLDAIASSPGVDELVEEVQRFLAPAVVHERQSKSTAVQIARATDRSDPDRRAGARSITLLDLAGEPENLQQFLKALRRRASVEAYQMLAQIEGELPDKKEQAAALRNVVRLQPKNVTAHLELAVALRGLNQIEDADRHFATALSLAADRPKELVRVGQARMQLGETRSAMDHFRHAVELAPGDVEVRFNLAMATQLQGQNVEAIQHYQQIMRSRPDWHEPANNLAWLYATHPDTEIRNGSEAVRLAREICAATDNQSASYLDTLAAALAETGDYSRAIRVVTRAIEQARGRGQHQLEENLRARREQYRRGKPYRDFR